MADQETARERLARLMDERRSELRRTWAEVANEAGITRQGLSRLRAGTGLIRSTTKRGLEDALRWQPRSIDRILAGGYPDPIPEGASEDEFTRLDRMYEAWRRSVDAEDDQDRTRGHVLRELLESWGDRDRDTG
ncbi:hypothetical protein [Actinomadura rupiterrae]|uniref:hypothetical protein n=1 Tax=Actinomadura rupiterrae TaxID=559627 RepID=UPI0020A36806|nr:hypothetical protein [Actinomadura rupiterrae]MCP2339236.1 hypothetical protein [Actinomadura rupiterrae]